MKPRYRFFLYTFITLFFPLQIYSAVSMPNAFSNSMVLQRDMKVKIWGSASNGEQVSVSINGQTKSTTAQNGSWSVLLDPMSAGGPYTMTVKGTNTVTITDVYIGEVWQCAGQSNMDTRVSYYPHYSSIMNSTNLPKLRFLTIRQAGGVTNNVWETCTTPAKVGKLSCLGFFFGKELLEALDNVAIGLIVTAVGGTSIASWLDPATVASDPNIKTIDNSAGSMYNSWVKPVEGYTIRGTAWMQGEQDRSSGLANYYQDRLPQLINGWRKVWGVGDFPFLICQLANYGTVQTSPNESATSAVIREAQRLGLSVPNTDLVVYIDIGDSLHFGNKQEAGRRLALPARAKVYGESNLVYSGPLFIEKFIDGSKIHCRFIHTGGGLQAKSGELKGFAIAGSDKNFVWANAVIHNDTVTVSSPSVPNPVHVRYAYAGNPIGNLINKEGLPASPFTTEGKQLSITRYTLATSVFSGEGTISPSGGIYLPEDTVTLSANAATGYIFDHWTGDLSGSSNPVKLVMDANKTVSAVFVADNKTYFSINTHISGLGRIDQVPSGTRVAEGSQVSFKATASKGWKFAGWSGDYTGTGEEYIISSLNKNIDLTALFIPENLFLYEAEDAIITDGVAESVNAGFSGTGYANVDNKIGSSIEIPVYVEHAGQRTITITFANGSTAARSFTIHVNREEVIASQVFEVTGAWTTWNKKEITLTLVQGVNTIKFTSNAADGGPNIDKIEIDNQTSISKGYLSEKASFKIRSGKLEITCLRPTVPVRVDLYNISGRKISCWNIRSDNNSRVSLPLGNLRNGNYIVHITIENSTNVQRLMFVQ